MLGRPAERHTPSMIIVGILPRDFQPPEAFFPNDEVPEFYRPLQSDDRRYGRRGTRRLLVLGRLDRAASVEQARAEAVRIAAELAVEFPEDNVRSDGSHLGIGLNDLHDQTVGSTGKALGIFLGAAGLLLLLAAMNAATLLLSREHAVALGVQPKIAFRGFAVAGCEPDEMGIGPVFAVPKLLKRCGLAVDDIDLWELNEAFAVQTVYCRDRLGIDPDELNVNGGSISV